MIIPLDQIKISKREMGTDIIQYSASLVLQSTINELKGPDIFINEKHIENQLKRNIINILYPPDTIREIKESIIFSDKYTALKKVDELFSMDESN